MGDKKETVAAVVWHSEHEQEDEVGESKIGFMW